MDVSPDDLSAILMVLKDAGVRRARVTPDLLEVEFEGAEPQIVVERSDDEPAHDVVKSVPVAVGYEKLFGAKFPGFAKNPSAVNAQ